MAGYAGRLGGLLACLVLVIGSQAGGSVAHAAGSGTRPTGTQAAGAPADATGAQPRGNQAVAQAAAVTGLPSGTDVDYQLGGAATPASRVGIVVRDRTEAPAAGVYNVCYLNAFQTQPDEKAFWRARPALVLRRHGHPVKDAAWGEWLLDIGTAARRERLARIMNGWIDGCASAGYDAVEFDNLDSYTRSRHRLSRADAIAYARLLVAAAHTAGLAAGQKNLAGYDGTAIGYDFAVAEECGRWRECARYVDHYGDQVVMIEYRRSDFAWTCERYGDDVAVELRDLELTPGGVHEWC